MTKETVQHHNPPDLHGKTKQHRMQQEHTNENSHECIRLEFKGNENMTKGNNKPVVSAATSYLPDNDMLRCCNKNEPTSGNTVSSQHFIRRIAHHGRFPLRLRAETKHPSGENLVFLGVFFLVFKGVENRARVYSFRRRGMFSYERQRQLFPLV